MARQWVYDTCRREWQRVPSQLGLLTATDLTFAVGTKPRLMGGVILLLWSGTCSLQLAGNSGQGANLWGFCLKTLRCHITEFNIQLMGKFPPQKLAIHNGATFLLCIQGLIFFFYAKKPSHLISVQFPVHECLGLIFVSVKNANRVPATCNVPMHWYDLQGSGQRATPPSC